MTGLRLIAAGVALCALTSGCGKECTEAFPGSKQDGVVCRLPGEPEAGKRSPMPEGGRAGTAPFPTAGVAPRDAGSREEDAGTDASESMVETCGNGLLDPGEACDFDCPVSCDTVNKCLVGRLEGSVDECTAVCKQTRVEACKGGDGCCAEGCNSTNDSDCSASCGDGEVQAPETCDGDCPESCDDGEACTVDMQTGTADQCSLVCMHEPARANRTPDGCCPAGANVSTDPDCPQRCGDGVVTGDETCDRGARACPTTCDDSNPCTMDVLTGSAAECDVKCSNTRAAAGTACGTGKCDAAGACIQPRCGDGRVDPGEMCDGNCPTACEPPLNECQTHEVVGTGCQRHCERGDLETGAMCNETRGACTGEGTCSRQAWYQGCIRDEGCLGALPCDENRNICTRECSGGAGECGFGGACIGGICQLQCTTDTDCKTGQTCGTYEGNRLCRPKTCSPDSQSTTLSCPSGFECLENANGIMRCVGVG